MIRLPAHLRVGTAGRRGLLVQTICLAISCAAFWGAARAVGAQYASYQNSQQESVCLHRLQRLAHALLRYHQDHPQVPVDRVTAGMLFPKYVADKAVFQCPASEPPRAGCDTRGVHSTYTWVIFDPDWRYVRRRRGGETPILCCSRHAFTGKADGMVNVARLSGAVTRVKLPLGVSSGEW